MMIFYQDIKARKVYWFLFPIVAFCSAALLYKAMFLEVFVITVLVNTAFISILFLAIYAYSTVKLNTPIAETFGLGDALLFIALIFTFSSLSFAVIFVFGLLFSLLIHLVVKRRSKFTTVPLAGYLSLFFGITYVAYWSGFIHSIYLL